MNKAKHIVDIFFILGIVILVSSCASTLSNKGSFVRVTSQSDEIKNCIHLGQVSSASSWGGFAATGVGFESAMNDLKNKAAAMGADSILTQVISNTMGGTRMIGDAYKCKNNNDQ